MPDKDGYPTELELKKIINWDSIKDPMGLVKYVQALWYYPDRVSITYGRNRLTGSKEKRLYLSTAGWSGNESIIEALQENPFWFFYWYKSQRGGHFWFRIPLKKRGEK